MAADHFDGVDQFEADLWRIADDLRANSGLASNEYFMPVMGLIFLRHSANRYYEAQAAIETDQADVKMPKRQLAKADFVNRWQYGAPPDEGIARIADNSSSRQVDL